MSQTQFTGLARATWAHFGNSRIFGYGYGGWEYFACLTLLAVVQSLLGDGAFAFKRFLFPTEIAKFSQKEAMQ